jgi:hypothetical protein
MQLSVHAVKLLYSHPAAGSALRWLAKGRAQWLAAPGTRNADEAAEASSESYILSLFLCVDYTSCMSRALREIVSR